MEIARGKHRRDRQKTRRFSAARAPIGEWRMRDSENWDAVFAEYWAAPYSIRSFTTEQKNKLWKSSKGKCSYCGAKLIKAAAEYDHIIPWARGGLTDVTNGAVSCLTCNRKKIVRDKAHTFIGANLFIRRICRTVIGPEYWGRYSQPSWKVLRMFDCSGDIL